MDAGNIWVQLGLDDKDFKDGIKRTEAHLGGLGKKMQSIGAGMSLGITAPLTMAGGYIFKFTKDWEENMAKINTTAQLSGEELKALSDTLKNLGGSVNADMSKVPVAYEKIISQTGDAALSTQILEAALKGAKAGFADLDVVAGAIAQSLSAVGAGGATAQEIIDTLFAAKRVGAGEFEDFAAYIPQLIAAGKNLGVTYTEVAGAFAYMTGKGNDAASSAMLLQNAFSVLGRGEIQEGLKSVGVAVYDADGKMRGLTDIFGDLSGVIGDMTDNEVSAFYESIGLVDMQAKQAFSVMTSEVSKLEEAMSATANATGELDTALGFAANPANTLQEAMSMLQQIALGFGDILLPALNAVIFKLNIMLKWVSNLSEGQKKWIVTLAGVAAAIGPVLVGLGSFLKVIPSLNSGLMSVVKIAGKMTTALMANPYLAAAAAIIFLISVLYMYGKTQEDLKKDWEALKKAWTDTRALEQIMGIYKEIFGGIWSAVTDVISVFQDLLKALGITTSAASEFEIILRAWLVGMKLSSAPLRLVVKLVSTLTGAVRGIVDVFKDWKNLSIEDIFNKIGDGLRDLVQNNPVTDLGNSIKEVFTGASEDSGTFQDAMRFDFKEMKKTAQEGSQTVEDMASRFAASFENMSDAQRSSIKAVRLEYLKSVDEWIAGAVAKLKAEGFLNQSLTAQIAALDAFAKEAKAKMDSAVAAITSEGGGSYTPGDITAPETGGAVQAANELETALAAVNNEYRRAIALSTDREDKLVAELKAAEDTTAIYEKLYALDGYSDEELLMLNAYKLAVEEIQTALTEMQLEKERIAESTRFKEALTSEIEAIQDSLRTEEELIQKSYDDRVNTIDTGIEQGILSVEEGNAMIIQLTADMNAALAENGIQIVGWAKRWTDSVAQIGDALETMATDMAVQFLAGISQIGKGTGLGIGILNTFVDAMMQVGKIIIAAGIGALQLGTALKTALASPAGPIAAIAAGSALVILAGAAKASLAGVGTQGLATGGLVTSGGVFKVGEEGEELVSLPRGSAVTPNHMLNGGGQGGYIASTRIAGRDLEILIERSAAQTKRR